uniref:NcSP23 protein n=1 Tax=Nephotettix cincticeps TaxID=94400 RepID=A0A0E4AVG3_NEPCI|nr:NcSP23 [Nephotettix cincticeps]
MLPLMCVFATGFLGLITATEVQDVSTCRNSLLLRNNVNAKLIEFASEKTWSYKYVPDFENNKDLTSMSLIISPTTSPANSYLLHTIYRIKNYKINPPVDDTVFLDTNGEIVSSTVSGGQPKYKYAIIDYQPGKSAYIYKCTTEQGIDGPDHRYILSLDDFTEEEQKKIEEDDAKYEWIGKIIKV